MKPAAFEYHRPTNLEAALALLASDQEARILAGGQSLVPMMNFRLAQPKQLVDINRLPDLDYIRDEGNHIAIGALARHAHIKADPVVAEHLPLVSSVYEWVAHSAVRNRGTLCGNLCHADPASEMPAIMQVLDAEMVISKVGETRTIPAESFFVGTFETALKSDEMLTEVRIPKMSEETGWGFEEVSMRKGDFAWAAVAATVRLNDGKIDKPCIAASGIGDQAVRLKELETAIEGKEPEAEMLSLVSAKEAERAKPNGSAAVNSEYRKDLLSTLLPRVLDAALQRAKQ